MKHTAAPFEHRVLALISVAVPTVFLGIAVTMAQSYNPRSINHDLFNQRLFRTHIRDVHRYDDPTVDTVQHPAAAEAPAAPLTVDDLTGEHRATLRRQLRSGGCPQDVDDEYRILCESLLKHRAAPELRQGLRNPHQ